MKKSKAKTKSAPTKPKAKTTSTKRTPPLKSGGAIVGGTDPCVCGDATEEHGRDSDYPSSTACTVVGCDCVAYEANHQDENDL